MSTAHLPTTGQRGRVRPGPQWRRWDYDQLRLERLAADVGQAAESYDHCPEVHAVIVSCASALRTAAATLAIDPE